jgi:hypothetical protein
MSTRAMIQAASDDTKFLVSYTIEHYVTYNEQVVLSKQETLRFIDDHQYIVIARREEVELTFVQASQCTLDEDAIRLINNIPTAKGILQQIHQSMMDD